MKNYIILTLHIATLAAHAAISKENFHKYIKENKCALKQRGILTGFFPEFNQELLYISSTCTTGKIPKRGSKHLKKPLASFL